MKLYFLLMLFKVTSPSPSIVKGKFICPALEIHRKYFTASEAADYLGMHRTHMTNLVARGLIKPRFHGEILFRKNIQ
ncbi:helix-turn-helix domain-containing protein [Acinetobacter terrae]|uniref:helix-turn-helix domain-containing protein n=1 Tax=Acinetobacter terrae TaxID=2731247 RepID=UPI00331436CD